MINKKIFASAFTLQGTIIGAGVLGLPYVFARSGFFAGMFWLVFLGLMLLFVNLSLSEISLRTKGTHQLTGYAKKYLGKWGERIMLLAFGFGTYSALIAYLIGEGRSLSMIITGNEGSIILFGFLFWIIIGALLHEGLKGLKDVETYGIMAIIVIIGIIFFWLLPEINYSNLSHINSSKFFFPFGVVLFAYGGFAAIPELRREIKGQEKDMKKAVILGSLIPFIIYILFTLSMVGFLGSEVKEVATLSFEGIFGKFVNMLGIFTMFTSYFVLSFSLKDTFQYDYNLNPKMTFFLVSLLPFLLFFIITYFNLGGFISVLGIGGAISYGLLGSLIVIISLSAKKKGKRNPEFQMPLNWIIGTIIIFVFILGVLTELFL